MELPPGTEPRVDATESSFVMRSGMGRGRPALYVPPASPRSVKPDSESAKDGLFEAKDGDRAKGRERTTARGVLADDVPGTVDGRGKGKVLRVVTLVLTANTALGRAPPKSRTAHPRCTGAICLGPVVVGRAVWDAKSNPLKTGFTWMKEPLPKISASATARRLTHSKATPATTPSTQISVFERPLAFGVSSALSATELSSLFVRLLVPGTIRSMRSVWAQIHGLDTLQAPLSPIGQAQAQGTIHSHPEHCAA